MQNYLIYALSILMSFVLWIIIFIIMKKSKGRSKDVKGVLLLGPAHFILRRVGYKLTMRELIGWGVVLLFMLIAPLITHWLEK